MSATRPEHLSVAERVLAVIQEELGLQEAPALTARLRDLGADSLDIVEITLSLEHEFECDIDDDHAERWSTVQSVIEYILWRTAVPAVPNP